MPTCHYPDSNVHGANMGPIWGQQDPDGPNVGTMNFAIWVDCLHAASDHKFGTMITQVFCDETSN